MFRLKVVEVCRAAAEAIFWSKIMRAKRILLVVCALLFLNPTLACPPSVHGSAADAIRIAFVPGVANDPFYITMESGIAQAAADLGIEVTTYAPERFDPASQIPVIESLVERGDIDYLIVAPTDMLQLIPVLEEAHRGGIRVITVDTFIGDGDYATGSVTFPVSLIGSDNFTGGFLACRTLSDLLDEGASIYIQNVRPGISTTDQRERGCQAAAFAYGLEIVGVDYNSDNTDLAQQQTTAALNAYPDLVGIFATNTFGAHGAGRAVQQAGLGGTVKVVGFDATPNAANLVRQGILTAVIAQKPYDMGYLATALAVAHAHRYESFPKRIPTGYVLINGDNADDPGTMNYIYHTSVQEPAPPLTNLTIGFVPGVDQDPFFITMAKGVSAGIEAYGIKLVHGEPGHFSPPAQIPVINTLVAENDIDYLITAPTDRNDMIPVLQQVYDMGIRVITVDTFIGDGDYEAGQVTFPLTYIGSDNVRGGYIGCSQLTMADILGTGAKIYIQNVRPGISTTDQRAEGCLAAAEDFGLEVVQVDYSNNDVDVGKAQTIAILATNPDIVGIFGTNVFSAQGAGAAVQEVGLDGMVEVVAYDSTEFAIDLLRDGTVTQVIAQKPADMGYFAVLCAVADARGVTSIPKRWATGHEVINIGNVDDPEIARFIYRED